MTTVYVSDDPEYTPAMTGKSVDADAYGRVWLATAPAVARKFGCRIEAILAARRSAEEWEHWNRNSEGGNDALAVEVWQAMHDAYWE
jgi:hypothetical protein